jgi:hypothetical protein
MAQFKTFEWAPIHGGGDQYMKFFPNGYGVSIVKHKYSYGNDRGLWELAVLKGNKDEWDICYDTPVTNDVIGHLSEAEVDDVVAKVEVLLQNIV